MFKSATEVQDVSDETILEIVKNGWDTSLSDILDTVSIDVLAEAKRIELEAEKIAFAIRNRYNSILENDESDEDDESLIDEFMNQIASELGQCYNGEYEYQPDYFWVPSTC